MHTSTFWFKFGSSSLAVTLKNRSRLLKPNQLFIISHVISMQISLKSAYQFMRYGAPKHFWLKFGSLSPAVTLKIRSRSPKPYQLYIMSQRYIHANLVKINTPVHEILCIQESVTQMPTPTPTGSAPKTICPPPLRWGT